MRSVRKADCCAAAAVAVCVGVEVVAEVLQLGADRLLEVDCVGV
jgi:hypothetical protein